MALPRCALVLSLLAVSPCQVLAEQGGLNPIRKVVTMLQAMQKKVAEEGAAEGELYEKFMCYCKTNGAGLSGSISAAEEKIPAVSSNIEESEAKLVGSKADLKQAQVDRTSAKTAMAEATAMREKEAATFASLKSEQDTNLAALKQAIAAVEKGMAGSFLQTPSAQALRRASAKVDLPESDQQVLTAFFSQDSSYAPQSGEITGILKQMSDTMAQNLADATATEEDAIKNYKGLMAAKTKEVAALTATVEAKTQQIGDLGVSIVMMKEDLSDTQASLADDKKFIANLDKTCATKTAEWEERSKTRAEELVALADTIKVLNDDDALELFKKTLPSPSASLMQISQARSAIRTRALAAVQSAQGVANAQDKPALEFLVLALTGRQARTAGGFDNVIKMVDEMVAVLDKEQNDDNDKKEYCGMQFDHSDDKKKALERTIAKEESAVSTAKEMIATLTEEIAELTAGIMALDKAVASATQQRKEENAEFKALIVANTAAKKVLDFAMNRLNQFYNTRLAKAVLAQVSLHQQQTDAPAPPPATWGAYASKSEESTGVIAMIDILIKDLVKEMTEATTEEKDAQADYEQMMRDSADKRTTDSAALTQKGSAKADMEAQLESHTAAKAAGVKELLATVEYIKDLHANCDWLLQYFDVRKEARSGEIDSLKKAKDVLSGSDYSLLQTQAGHSLRGSQK